MLGMYVHIPFCASKCAYCDFLSFAGQRTSIPPYITALHGELQGYAKLYAKTPLQTVFFGGGTPTTVPAPLLAETLAHIAQLFPIALGAEITIEANPETADYDALRTLHQAGFNRISFGVQSFDNAILRRIGRIHTAEAAERAITNARQAGFQNINLDLMFGLPNQTEADWRYTLDTAIALDPEHLSCYSLIVEDGTPLAQESNLALPGEEADRLMYHLAKERLAAADYIQYEISNFAKPGYASHHNTMYWTGGDYIGAGLGAHSLLGDRRICNTTELPRYLAGDFGRETLESLSDTDRQSEFMILGLRMTDGVSISDFQNRFGRALMRVFGPTIDGFIRDGLLTLDGDRLRLTPRGVDISNIVFAEFLSANV